MHTKQVSLDAAAAGRRLPRQDHGQHPWRGAVAARRRRGSHAGDQRPVAQRRHGPGVAVVLTRKTTAGRGGASETSWVCRCRFQATTGHQERPGVRRCRSASARPRRPRRAPGRAARRSGRPGTAGCASSASKRSKLGDAKPTPDGDRDHGDDAPRRAPARAPRRASSTPARSPPRARAAEHDQQRDRRDQVALVAREAVLRSCRRRAPARRSPAPTSTAIARSRRATTPWPPRRPARPSAGR